MNELIKKEFYEVIPKDDIEFIKNFDELEKRAKVIKDTMKTKGYEFLEKNELLEEGYEQDGIRLTWKKPFTRKVVDTQEMIKQGIYEDFTKESKVSGSVLISVIYED